MINSDLGTGCQEIFVKLRSSKSKQRFKKQSGLNFGARASASTDSRKRSAAGVCFLLIFLMFAVGCSDSYELQLTGISIGPETDLARSRPLGWLQATAQPLPSVARFRNENKTIVTGGVVIDAISSESPLQLAGVQEKDVIVRVADTWIPIKEDPTIDLIAAIEDQISAMKATIELGLLRDGTLVEVEIEVKQESIDKGLPGPSHRLMENGFSCLRRLANLQQPDGSFPADVSAADDLNANLRLTALAGLAFLSAPEPHRSEYRENIGQCVSFVSSVLDGRQEIDPLTAAFVGCFLGETDVDLLEDSWLDRIGKLVQVFETTQNRDGSWNTEVSPDQNSSESQPSKEEQEQTVEVHGVYTSAQVLLAIGVLERKGMSTEQLTIESGCRFLNGQAGIRLISDLDRRLKAVLNAATVAGLVSVNCSTNHPQIVQWLSRSLERADDMLLSPNLALPGLLNLAIACNQNSLEYRLEFHHAIKHKLAMLVSIDGYVAMNVENPADGLALDRQMNSESGRLAHLALIQLLPAKKLSRLLAEQREPDLPIRDINGAIQESNNVVAVEDADESKSDQAAELKEMILRQLREAGMDVDESKLTPGPDKPKK